MLLNAYAQGIFPMAHREEDWDVYWYAPDPRAILEFEDFHASRRLRQTVRQEPFEIRYSTAFEKVMRACAEPRGDAEGTWISEDLVAAYVELHELGFAHSVEAWDGDELVGGLYGIALRGLFAGESMFHRADDASKVSLVHLMERLQERGYVLLDIQFMTPHLEKFGAKEIPRVEYEKRVAEAMRVEAKFV